MPNALDQIFRFVLTVGVIGLLAHFLGESLNREWFNWNRFPYALHDWEKKGKFYSQYFKIDRWKNRLPDKSRVVKSTVEKSIGPRDLTPGHTRRLIQETCVAELVHWVLLFISPVLLIVMDGPWSIVMTVLYGLSNLPFIMIQRYNRPRLLRLYVRMAGRQAVPGKSAAPLKGGVPLEGADPVLE